VLFNTPGVFFYTPKVFFNTPGVFSALPGVRTMMVLAHEVSRQTFGGMENNP
jgi:hypothetical protein